jgi:hypothetical protein
VEPLDEHHRYRCVACGNLTRFDVVERRRARRYYHFSLAGELRIEEDEVLEAEVEAVVCRWCGSPGTVEVVARVGEEDSAPDVAR